MRRTKEWWAVLTAEERNELVYLERAKKHCGGLGGYLPDDCGECGYCSQPCLGGGLCPPCLHRLIFLVGKADNALRI